MVKETTYQEYVEDLDLYRKYSKYQQRYADKIRESDRYLIEIIKEIVSEEGNSAISLLDIGCSTGNLLFHIKNALPTLRLTGGDGMAPVIEECRKDPRLVGIDFQKMDILEIPGKASFDIIVGNAVTYLLDASEYDASIESVGRSLTDGGSYVGFEWMHPFKCDLKIVETSRSHPQGLTIYVRPYSAVEAALTKHGFGDIEFRPFQIGIDLPLDYTFGDNEDGFEDLNSYTVKTAEGERLLFRGPLFQPWCFVIARKKYSK